jgi:Arc/MetJ-type ribon-helix-helix transcriptional regulator
MDISVSPEAKRMIEERMKRGGYATPADVMLAALGALEQAEQSGDFEPGELDTLLAEGESSGEPLDGEQVFKELRELPSRRDKAG